MEANKKRTAGICIIALVCLILYLCFINNIILIGRRHPERISAGYKELNQSTVLSSVDNYSSLDNFLEEVFFEGWALIGTDKPYQDRKIGIALSDSRGRMYLCTTDDLFDRIDVYKNYKGKIKMSGAGHGFSLTFSTITLPDGKYNVGVYCCENPECFGVDFSGEIVLEKNGKKVNVGKITSDKAAVPESPIDDSARYYIDSVEIGQDNSVEIRGWALVPETDSQTQEKYVLLVYSDGLPVLYETTPMFRNDVAEAFSSDLYIQSGFCAEIPSGLLQSDDFDTYILVKDGEGMHTSSAVLDYVEDAVSILQESSTQ